MQEIILTNKKHGMLALIFSILGILLGIGVAIVGILISEGILARDERLGTVLPLAAKYGAMVVGLTLDEKGIPETAAERIEIAKRIIDRAAHYGIDKSDIIIDPLTMTISTAENGALPTLDALRILRDELGIHSVLGVSNISFGLPNRELVNCNFLQIALANGLDLPIMNPNVASMTGAVRAFKLLTNIDKNSAEFIAAYNDTATKPQAQKADSEISLGYAIENGLKEASAEATEKMLEILPKVRSLTAEWNSLVSDGISEDEFAVFQSVLLRMEKNARKIIEGKEKTPEE